MDTSAYEALIIAINTFIFIVALSVAMVLMTTINEMVDYAKVNVESLVGGNLIQEYGETQERTFTGAEVFAFYGQLLNKEYSDSIKIYVSTGGVTREIEDYATATGTGYLSKTFILECTGENRYIFRLKED